MQEKVSIPNRQCNANYAAAPQAFLLRRSVALIGAATLQSFVKVTRDQIQSSKVKFSLQLRALGVHDGQFFWLE